MLRFCLTALSVSALAWAQAPAAPSKTPAPPAPAREPGLYATINTSMGPIVVKFYEKESPITVKNFTDLARGLKTFTDSKTGQPAKRPFYTGLIFHRVIPNFMIQGGDPTGTGSGDGGMKPIPDEFDPSLKFDQPGRLAMANSGPRTGTCQFFITEVPVPHLNGLHTIFGQVVEGQELVGKIARVPANPANNKPRTPVIIRTVVIKREGPAPASPVKPPVKKAAPAVKTAAPAVKKAVPAVKKAAPPAKN